MHLTFPSIFPVTCHTNYVGSGTTFVAINGYKENGVAYILQALERGATTIVVHQDEQLAPAIITAIKAAGARLLRVENTRLALAELSAQAHGYPARTVKIIGVTGTKGKTTSVFLLEHIFRAAGHKTALISTVKNIINGQELPMQLTTPQPDYLHAFFKKCVDHGVEYVIMEVAAQALSLHRVHGIQFDGVIFTNFAQEHAEFYPTMEEYFAAKARIVEHLKPHAPFLVNADDQNLEKLARSHKNSISFGLKNSAAVQGVVSGIMRNGIHLRVDSNEFSCPALIGSFNVYNVLGVLGLAINMGIAIPALQNALLSFSRVPGRLEGYSLPNGARAFIDYAHNPSSYHAVLSTLRELTDHLIVVFGCGGERDASKRPLMGSLAVQFADLVILTSDNPRSENPATIINDIKAGITAEHAHKIIEEVDREKAINIAYSNSRAHSLIVLLGKGPDEYQQIGSIKYPFSEAAIIKSLR